SAACAQAYGQTWSDRVHLNQADTIRLHPTKISIEAFTTRAGRPDGYERYIDGDIDIDVDVVCTSGLKISKLVFSSVPFGGCVEMQSSNDTIAKQDPCICDRHGSERSVDLLVSQVVQSPDGPIPSAVRFEREEEFLEFNRNLGLLPPEVIASVLFGFSEGELRKFRARLPAQSLSSVVNNMVKTRSQGMKDVESDGTKFNGRATLDLGFKQMQASASVSLTEESVGVCSTVLPLQLLELRNPALRMSDESACTF
ncbi:MAG: hypothetical protein KKC43_09790, partial [Alphaproteobacteria bacterium]|nr:hypothetical protein [Alphaproteobacteria bacterium]